MVDVINVLAVYCLWLNLFGTVGNLIAFYVCLQLRKNTTFVFLSFISISDLASLYFWNINNFITVYFNFDLQEYNIYSCRIGYLIQFASLHISAWLLVLMTLDRLLSFLNIRWKNFFTTFKATVLCFICVGVFILLNLNVLFVYGEVINVNGTEVTLCFSTGDEITQWTATWDIVHSCLYSYAPFALLLIMNFLLILFYNNRSVQGVGNDASRKRQAAMNRTVISVTLLFIVMTGPGAVVSTMYTYILSLSFGQLLIILGDSIAFSYHAYGLIILYHTNVKFANQLKATAGVRERSDSRSVSNRPGTNKSNAISAVHSHLSGK